MWKIKYKVIDHCHYTGKYRGAAHSICNLTYSITKEIPTVFYIGYNYDYHFVLKELAEEFEAQFICLGENTKKYLPFQFQCKIKLQELIKVEEKFQKEYSTDDNLLKAQDLWQAHYQILLMNS